MIHNDAEYQHCLEQMTRMYRILGGLRTEVAPQSEMSYKLMSEGPIDYIRGFQREIDEYLGIAEPAATTSRSE